MNMNERFNRTARIIGEDGVERLSQSCVVIFGLGGVGASCAESLARSGVGSIILIDKDTVEPSDVNRQAIAFSSTLRCAKVSVMSEMAHEINPNIKTVSFQEFINSENIYDIMSTIYSMGYAPNFIVDAFDTLSVKSLIMQYALEHDIPIISAMGGANKTDPTLLEFAKLSETRVCPLCREMRKIARKSSPDIFDVCVLYSPEAPVRVSADANAERMQKTELGTMPYFPPIMGHMLAGYVINNLL